MIGPVTAPAKAGRAFSHASEVASPGYYEIRVGMPRRDGRTVYVAGLGSNEVSRIDLTTMTPLAPIPAGLDPVAVGLDASGSTLFVVDQDDNDCLPIDLSTLRAGAPIPLGDRPMSFAR